MDEKAEATQSKISDLYSTKTDLRDKADKEAKREAAARVGYQTSDFEQVPEEALLGIGCGNPVALAALKPGQIVLDLGSGAGFDVFLAANQVGPEGHVIGVDMNPLMLERAQTAAVDRGYKNVEFREGRIEELPLESNSIDVVISNCVINLSPYKALIYYEIMRVLKPGGSFFVSDLFTSTPMPEWFLRIVSDVLGFKHWLLDRTEYLNLLSKPGFADIRVLNEIKGGFLLSCKDPACDAIFKSVPQEYRSQIPALAESIVSIKLAARKNDVPLQ